MLINNVNRFKLTYNIRNYSKLFTSFQRSFRLLAKLQTFANIKQATLTVVRDILSIEYNKKSIEYFYFENRRKKINNTLILVPGFSSEGIKDPRLFTLAYVLASEGYKVCVPKLLTLNSYRIDEAFYESVRTDVKALLKPFEDDKIGILAFHYSVPAVLKALNGRGGFDNICFLLSIGGCFDLFIHFKNIFMRNFKIKRIDRGFDFCQRFNRLLFFNSFKKELKIEHSHLLQDVVLSFLKGNFKRGIQGYSSLSDSEKNLFLNFYNGEDSIYYDFFKPNQEIIKNLLSDFSVSIGDLRSEIPLFLLHSINDGLVSYEQSQKFYKEFIKYYSNIYLSTTSILNNVLEFYSPWLNPGEWIKEISRISTIIVLATSLFDSPKGK